MPTLPEKLAYSIANVTAVLVALFVALWLDLDRPYWAMFTVFIVSKPVSGAVRAKGVYRFAGTLTGAAMAVFLVPPLVQSPVLLCLAVSLWVGLCLYLALLDRTPRSYAFLLAGYSVAIVGLSTVNAPTTIFDVAVSRLEEISIGIICAALAHSLFFPRNLGTVLREKADESFRAAVLAAADAIRKRVSPSAAQIAACGRAATDVYLLYRQIGFETSNVVRAPGVVTALLDRLALILPTASAIQQAAAALEKIAPISDALRASLDETAAFAAAYAEHGATDGESNLARLANLHEMSVEETTTQASALRQLVVRRSFELITTLAECRQLISALDDFAALSRVSGLLPEGSVRILYRDRGLAFLSAISAMTATLVACVLWIETSWPEGFVAAQFAAIVCSLFSTLDDPSETIGKAVTGIILALPVAAIYEFAILPRADGFPSLALALAPILFLLSWVQTYERLEGAAVIGAVAFAGALALQETYAADFASFVNANLAEVVGPLIALAVLLVFRTIDPVWNARRILRSGWIALGELARMGTNDIRAWIVLMFDRATQAAMRLADSASGESEQDLLRDLRVGLNLAALDRCKERLGRSFAQGARESMAELSDLYARRQDQAPFPPPDRRSSGLRHLMDELGAQPPSDARLEGLIALAGLRLDVDPTLTAAEAPA